MSTARKATFRFKLLLYSQSLVISIRNQFMPDQDMLCNTRKQDPNATQSDEDTMPNLQKSSLECSRHTIQF